MQLYIFFLMKKLGCIGDEKFPLVIDTHYTCGRKSEWATYPIFIDHSFRLANWLKIMRTSDNNYNNYYTLCFRFC